MTTVKETGTKTDARQDTAGKFNRLLDELEELLDRGFFLSFIGKIIVDEKKVFSLLNELRSIARDTSRTVPASPRAENGEPKNLPLTTPRQETPSQSHPAVNSAEEDASRIREGADLYAEQVLSELEDKLLSILTVVQKGQDLIHTRQNQEVI